MTTSQRHHCSDQARAALTALIDDIGPLRALGLVAQHLFRRAARQNHPSAPEANDHLRKDIGLEPNPRPPEIRGPLF